MEVEQHGVVENPKTVQEKKKKKSVFVFELTAELTAFCGYLFPHVTVEGLPKGVMSTSLKTTPGTLKQMTTSEINLNSVDHNLVRAG